MPTGTSPLSPGSPTPFETRRFSIAEYHRLAEVGILSQDDRVELIEGVISPKMVHSPLHDATVSILEMLLRGCLASNWFLRIQSSITLSNSESEPDLAIVAGSPRQYLSNHPGPSDLALVIEVAESSLARDHRKALTYADAGITNYWIVNLQDKSVEVFADPSAKGYTMHSVMGSDSQLSLGTGFNAGTTLSVDDLCDVG